jgi:hypothetical protein
MEQTSSTTPCARGPIRKTLRNISSTTRMGGIFNTVRSIWVAHVHVRHALTMRRIQGDRPRFGEPSIGTLSIGGNNIDFPGIIFNCILEYRIGWGLGPEWLPCPEQRTKTWGLLNDAALLQDIDGIIKKIVAKANEHPNGKFFRLYVTGFPEFFDVTTTECDSVTFAIKPKEDGTSTKMTVELRKDFNAMSVKLNEVIERAALMNKVRGVEWISINQFMDTHRFCEPGITEPDQKNKNLWLFHYPYGQPDDAAYNEALRDAVNRLANSGNNNTFNTYSEYLNAVLENIEAPPGDPAVVQGVLDPLWRRAGNDFKTFHPQVPLHEKIRDAILDSYTRR